MASTGLSILVVGGGIVGSCCAWLLRERGHRVDLVDAGSPDGTAAALGLLMGGVFQRSGGRGWRLRRRSLELWSDWRARLAERGHAISYRPGLLVLAADEEQGRRQEALAVTRRRQGLALEFWPPERLETLHPALPGPARGALHSPADGQLDPLATTAILQRDARQRGLAIHRAAARRLRRDGSGWRLVLAGGEEIGAEAVVLAAGLGTSQLLASTGLAAPLPPLDPVLGQALELEAAPVPPRWTWPGSVVWKGVNLVPRPDGKRLWLGATLEPGRRADPAALDALRELDGAAPGWLRNAAERRRWQGLRPRPRGRPAPLLEAVAPGLLVVAGHYRNGVLLAPVSAEWAARALEGCGGGTTWP